MMYDIQKKELLTVLVEKYERSKLYTVGANYNRKILLRLHGHGKSDFEKYDIEDYTIREEYNHAIIDLSNMKYIKFEWVKYRENDIIEKIWLETSNIDAIYTFLKRKPKSQITEHALEVISRTKKQISIQWILDYLDSIYQIISTKRSIGSLMPHDETEAEDLMKALISINDLGSNEIYERIFSIKCFGNSKRFETTIRAKLISIIKKYYLADYEEISDEDILRMIGITKYPEIMEFCGGLKININGAVIDYMPLRMGATVNADDVRRGRFEINQNVKQVLFIENKANFVEYVTKEKTPEELVIFHGGCYSPIKGMFFQKIKEALCNTIEIYHWGDIDYGGFLIFERLKRDIFETLRPFRMSRLELVSHKEYTNTFDSKYAEKVASLKNKNHLSECYNCIDFMLEYNIKLEQEALLI